jgi:hypothetical protein
MVVCRGLVYTEGVALGVEHEVVEGHAMLRRDRGAQDRSSPNFMGLASFGLEIDNFCDFLYSILLLHAILFF